MRGVLFRWLADLGAGVDEGGDDAGVGAEEVVTRHARLARSIRQQISS